MATDRADNTLKEAKKWTPNQRRVMLWLATPEEERVPLTQGKLAAELGIHEVTLSEWKKKPGFMEEVQRMITDSLGDVYHDVMLALKRKSKAGNFPHLKLYLEMLGVYTPRIAVDHTHAMKQEAQRVADALGVPVEEVIAEAERIVAEAA